MDLWMGTCRKSKTKLADRRGAVIVTVAVVLAALLGMAALAVDGSYLMEIRSQMQNTADAAAMAGVSGLSVSPTEARARAADYARRNPVLRQQPQIRQSELMLGQWDYNTSRFTPTTGSPNGVRLTLRLSDTPELANLRLFFAPILGFRTADVFATATASLGNRNVMLALDRSNSMDDDNPNPPQPLTNMKIAAARFLDQLQSFPIRGDRAGYVMYNERATLVNQLTESYDNVQRSIQQTQLCTPGPGCTGHTNIAEAMDRTRRELTSSRASSRALKVAVLLSDGKPNTTNGGVPGDQCIPGVSPCQTIPGNPAEQQCLDQARQMRDRGIVLYTISLGNDTNQPLMEMMALATGGEHFYAPSTDQLDGIFQQISARVPVVLVE